MNTICSFLKIRVHTVMNMSFLSKKVLSQVLQLDVYILVNMIMSYVADTNNYSLF